MDRETFRAVRELLRPVQRKLALVASKCVVALAGDSTGMQTLQVANLAGEAPFEAEHMQPGGLSHVPVGGAEGVRVTVSGVYDDSVVLAVSNRDRRPKNLGAGETALYNASATQTTIVIKSTGDVEVTLADGAQLRVGGDDADYVALAGKVDEALALIAAHVHAAPGGTTETSSTLVDGFESVAAELTLTE